MDKVQSLHLEMTCESEMKQFINAWNQSMFDDYKRLTDVVQGCSRLDNRFKVGQFSDLWLAHLL